MSNAFTAPFNLTYNSLVEVIQDILQQTSPVFIGQIPVFIALAENTLSSSIHNLGQLKFANTTGITQIISKPTGWRQTKSILVSNTSLGLEQYALERSIEFCNQFNSETTDIYMSTVGQVPQWYADYSYDFIYLSPFNTATAATTNLQLAYYGIPDPLSTVNQVNWFCNFCPQALLYASLLHAAVYLRMLDREQEFREILMQAINAINSEDANRVDDQSYAIKPAVQKPLLG